MVSYSHVEYNIAKERGAKLDKAKQNKNKNRTVLPGFKSKTFSSLIFPEAKAFNVRNSFREHIKSRASYVYDFTVKMSRSKEVF